ncbi:hypothetical protein G9A89_003100 [Geosiphon pyriformis]|nr:hypothetical protein G9A89_003100 [Geosiphon pyriformis]
MRSSCCQYSWHFFFKPRLNEDNRIGNVKIGGKFNDIMNIKPRILFNFFFVQVEEVQVIHKQHAQMDDIQRAENSQERQMLAVEEVQQHQHEDLMEVKQWQKIHVVQVNFYRLFKNEHEEERLVQYEYSLSIDAFNENQNANNLVLGYQKRSKIR